VTLAGLQTVDGLSLVAGNRVLVKNQSAANDNGIWVAAVGAWVRATDADVTGEVSSGMFAFVEEGATNANSGWILSTPDPITLGTTPLTFTQFSNTGTISAGNGLTKTGSVIDVVGGDGILVAADLVSANIDPNAGLKFDASSPKKMQVALDGTSLQVSAAGLKVNPAVLGGTFITRETPSGAVNGSNTAFVLAQTPVAGSEHVYLNGLLQEPGAGNDYTIAGTAITYLAAPAATDRLRVSYRV